MWVVTVILCVRYARFNPMSKSRTFRFKWLANIYAWWNKRDYGDEWTAVVINKGSRI